MKIYSLFLIVALVLKYAVGKSVIRYDLDALEYQSEFYKWLSMGYRLISVSGYTSKNLEKYAAIWELRSDVAWIARHRMTASEFQMALSKEIPKRFRLTHLSGYVVNSQPFYAAIWEEIQGPEWKAFYKITSNEYQETLKSLTTQGYRLVFLNAYSINGNDFYAAIFDKSTVISWYTEHRMSPGQYENKSKSMQAQGYKLVSVSGYTRKILFFEFENYAALWIKTPKSYLCAANHNVKEEFFQGTCDNLRYQGYSPKYINAFQYGSNVRFSSIWENAIMDPDDVKVVKDAINEYMSAQQVTGLSLAVTKNERLVYAEAAGIADFMKNEPLTPNHAMRVMSISKTITSIGIMKLLEFRLLKSLDTKVFGNNSIFGFHYRVPSYNSNFLELVTVRQLLDHSSGLKTCFNEFVLTFPFSTHDIVMNTFLNDRDLFLFKPGTNSSYSNLGFLILGRVIEHLSHVPYETFIRDNILNKCQIGLTTFIGKADGYSHRPLEAQYYPPFKRNMQMFDSFAGWVATPIDLLKIMIRIDGSPIKSDILNSSFLNEMKNGSSCNGLGSSCIGLGLVLFGEQYGHSGIGGPTRASLYKLNNEISYSVIINSTPFDDDIGLLLKEKIEKALEAVKKWPSYDLF